MSRKKKVIHVKDLIIKADNVIIERRPGYRDPIFRMPRGEDIRREETESSEDVTSLDESRDEDDDRRRPFSWV